MKRVYQFRPKGILTLLLSVIAFSVSAQSITVRGTVTDQNNEPVIGATVVVEGNANQGTVTDVDGNYVLSNVRSDARLVFSFVGMKTQTVPVNGQSRIDVTLSEDTEMLEEVVVTALGIKRDSKALGYSVSSISAEDIIKTGTPNFATSLYGKASGVRIQAAPGGNTSAVSINVRGVSSITGTNQPLIIVNGIPIRNGDANNSDYWSDQRINSNGLVDINPEDIENLTILKGASASALYGSEAANGVVMITTKSGRGVLGLGVDFNASISGDYVAYMPEYQTVFGPGVRVGSRGDYEKETGGFWQRTYKGQTYKSVRTATATFGPKYDGSDILYYDGTIRKYEPISSNPWNEIFRTGINQVYNLGVTQGSENGNMRFSYTYVDNLPTQYNSTYNKHNFNLTGNYSLNDKLKLQYGANYIIQNIKNRPYRISRLTNNFSGMFNAWDDVKYIREHTVTSLGYMNVSSTEQSLTPDESFAFSPACSSLISEYFWNIYGKEQLENNNRFIANVTPSWQIIDGLTLQGRISTDYTTEKVENKNKTEKPLVFGSYTGYYGLSNRRYEIYYGDILLMFNRNLTEKIGLVANAGWQGRTEKSFISTVGTRDGLSVENWFHLNASKSTPSASMYKSEYLKTAFLGTASFSWDNYLFVEGTARQEKTSTLAKGNNSFFYPSVNTSIIYTDALRNKIPSWYDYGKLRFSYGKVGNAPEIYKAVQAFNQGSASGYIYNTVPTSVGNENIRPEQKYEYEIGWENKMLKNRLGFELSYYNNTVKDQILQTTMPASAGGTSILMNIGELKNHGVEFSVYGTPIQTKDWQWELRGNLAFNRNSVTKLNEGVDVLVHQDLDGGAVRIESHVGEPMGDIYAYAPLEDDKGNPIVGSDGFYKLTTERVKVGNAMPKSVGGISSTLTYKNVSFDATIDFRIGGAVVNTPYQYLMGRGSLVESMKYRDTEHGGLQFYFPGNDGSKMPVLYQGSTPNGEIVYDNGMILPGVKENGEPNDIVLESDKWYNWTYNWGVGDPTYYSHAIFDNSYVKVRELVLSYKLPKKYTSKFDCRNLTVSFFARNPFYIYKNLPIFDAEATDGTSWISQTIIGGSTATTRTFGVSLRATF
jgi:TonB-linked SusC/RagA family outer membrane protein